MPTLKHVGAYRFFFFSSDGGEPKHVHVERNSNRAKFWLTPVRLEKRGGFTGRELNRIQQLVEEHHEEFVRGWDDFFNQ